MRKKMVIIVLVCCALVGTLFATNSCSNNNKSENTIKTEIVFIEQDWAKALQQAKEKHKLIFVDLYATWCGPCKMLKRNTFTNKDVAEFFNSNFINSSIDVDKGIGMTLAQQYNVTMLPTLIITDEEGKPILMTTGYIDPKELLGFAKAALAKTKK